MSYDTVSLSHASAFVFSWLMSLKPMWPEFIFCALSSSLRGWNLCRSLLHLLCEFCSVCMGVSNNNWICVQFSNGFLIVCLCILADFCGQIIFCALISYGVLAKISWCDVGGSLGGICVWIHVYISVLCLSTSVHLWDFVWRAGTRSARSGSVDPVLCHHF